MAATHTAPRALGWPNETPIEYWTELPREPRDLDLTAPSAERNGCRADRALVALREYARHTYIRDDVEMFEVVTDLLGDLRHAADALGLDYQACEYVARGHYSSETKGD